MNEIQKDFVIINHTADVGIEAYGKTPEEIFVNMAKGMFSLITDPESVSEEICFDVNIKGEDRDSLLINWLNELIYLYDTENVVFKNSKSRN
ncbi:MAG: archease [Actinobacteria bacterium]|nr:archease [Actinomycetota bacterium]